MDRPHFCNLFSRSRPSTTVSRRRQSMDHSADSEIIRHPNLDSESFSLASTLKVDVHNLNISKTSSTPGSRTQHGRKSFSGLSNAVEELCSLPRRSFLPSRASRAVEDTDVKHGHFGVNADHRVDAKPSTHSKASEWLRRAASTRFRPRRHSTSAPMASFGQRPKTSYNNASGYRVVAEPPRWDSLDYSHTSGAAARAAAAAQNEFSSSARTLVTRGDNRFSDLKTTGDSESGIGIDLRDRVEESTEAAVPVVRQDPTLRLPEEIMAQILSYLDAESLMHSELVSRRWHSSGSSHLIWREVFRREYSNVSQAASLQPSQPRKAGPGLGKNAPGQDWKKVWKARKTLDARWADGYAAAIYLEGHSDSVYCVQFDEHKILTGSRDRTIRVWDANTYECLTVLGVPTTNPAAAIPLPLDKIGSKGNTPFTHLVSAHKVTVPARATPSIYHEGSVLCLQYDDDLMVTGSSDTTCIMWDMKDDYRPVRRLRKHTAGVLDVCFDEMHVVSCSKDTTICLWDRATGNLLRTLIAHRGPVNAVQLRGNLVVSASGDGVAKLWNLNSGHCIKEFPSKDRGLACVEFSLDSRTILTGGNDQVIYQFDANTGELVRELRGHRGLVRSLHLDGPNNRVVSGSYDNSVKAYDLTTGKMIADFPSWTTSWMLSAKADYRRIVAASQDSRAVIIDFGYQLPGVELLEGEP